MRYDERLVALVAAEFQGRHTLSLILSLLVLLVGLPLLGIALAGQPIDAYLAFPPDDDEVAHAPFSLGVFVVLSLAVLASVTPFVVRIARTRAAPARTRFAFPWWGWAGTAFLTLAWIFAWARFPWFAALQAYTFAPLWLGYILVINGLTRRRGGRCLLVDRPRELLALFLISAAFWWFFEFLNRFVQNWHYHGIAELSAGAYFWHATIAFSTVLPAVISTRDWFATFPRLDIGLRHFAPIRPRHPRAFAWAVLLIACTALLGLGVWPDYFFGFLWIAPLLAIVSLQALFGQTSVFSSIRHGDWRPLIIPAFAALFCGVFWEMWNSQSLAHWVYTVPFVDRFHLFEMPVLGYTGYLPFGMECAAVVSLFFPSPVVREVKLAHARRA
jgi:hypothetical protein